MNASSPFGNVHADVLGATPEDEAGITALKGELSARAKVAMSQKNYPVADALYSKSIDVGSPDAATYGNRSAARYGLGRYENALADATSAISIDEGYAKGYFRKGQACSKLKRHKDAADAFDEGARLEPKNKTFKKLAAGAHEAASAVAADATVSKKPSSSTKAPVRKQSNQTKETTARKPSSVSSVDSKVKCEDDEEAGIEKIRGYKKTSDGRTTTFFNNELDETAKRLIGSIEPKKIDAPVVSNTVEGTSAWNTAGTWEERTVTPWAKGRLEELLLSVQYTVNETVGAVKVEKVSEMVGDASITSMRGKKKHPFDFAFVLEWSLDSPANCFSGPCKGKLRYPDVTPDCDGDYDTLYEVDRNTPPQARAVLDQFVKNLGAGLQPEVGKAIATFIKEFNAM